MLTGLSRWSLPSFRVSSEGSPHILMEAMASGLPCLATRVGDVAHLARDGHSALLVPYGHSAALAAGLARLLDDEKLRLSLGQAARQRMARQFTAAREAQAWAEVDGQLIDLPAR